LVKSKIATGTALSKRSSRCDFKRAGCNETHLEQYENRYTSTVKSLRDDTYVGDIQGGGKSEEDVIKFMVESTEIMNEAGFELHKWHSNCPAVK
jgi:hypothetical protein